MEYIKREIGVVLNGFNPVIWVIGSLNNVEFPFSIIWEWHKSFPGYITEAIHLHPPECSWLSTEDKTSLKGWTLAFTPYLIKWSSVSLCKDHPNLAMVLTAQYDKIDHGGFIYKEIRKVLDLRYISSPRDIIIKKLVELGHQN